MAEAIKLGLSEFSIDEASGVRVPPRAGTAASYLDGAELGLLRALESCGDVSLHSRELRDHVRDWATLYHLTPYRATILDCLGLTERRTRVLELGAGCGAVTRWLGEHLDEVHAVEGSLARARVARERCRDLESVRVYSSNFFDVDFDGAFDVATLIGVLEYSHLYHPEFRDDPDAAALSNLELAHDALRERGLLIVAIENKLGLKYLSGAREDHSSRHFEGIQGYPSRSSAVTWSARELRALVRRAGFSAVDLHLPFPDYKLARTILASEHVAPETFPHNWVETPFPDRTAAGRPQLWNESLVLRELGRAGLVEALANSFLLLAYKGDADEVRRERGLDNGWLARAYSLDRHPAFAKRASLERGAEGLVVRNTAVVPGAPDPGTIEHAFADEPFRPGDQAVYPLFEAAAAGRLDAELERLVVRLRDELVLRYGAGQDDDLGVPLLRGDALDFTLWNAVVHPEDASWQPIDGEWTFPRLLPLDFVIWRGLLHLAARCATTLWSEAPAPAEFARAWTLRVVPAAARRPAAALAELEDYVQYAVGALAPARARALEHAWHGREPASVRGLPVREAAPAGAPVVAFAEELVAVPELLDLYASLHRGDARSTLVVYAPDADSEAVAGRLSVALADAGLDGEDDDIVLLAVPGSAECERELAASARALLTQRAVAMPWTAVPRLGRHRFVSEQAATLADGLGAAFGTGIPRLIADGVDADLDALREALTAAPAGVVAVRRDGSTAAELAERLAGHGLGVDFVGYAGPAALAIVRGASVPAPAPAPDGFCVVAVVSCFNEADILEGTVRDLVAQGVEPYVLDNWSTDETWEMAQALGAEGLLCGSERFPASEPATTFELAQILTRVAELGASLGSDWVVHHDADERRRSPWPGVGLRDALHSVQSRGFNAVDHTVAVFHPVDDSFEPGLDLERTLVHFEFGGRPGHFVQVKAWRNTGAPVDLASTGGHTAAFPDRRVFPYKFLLKHYPIRSQRHGEQKIFHDRRGRWSSRERARGWHHQYDALSAGHRFLRPPEELTEAVPGAFEEEFLLERIAGIGIARERAAA